VTADAAGTPGLSKEKSMLIRYAKGGRILSCAADDWESKEGPAADSHAVLKVPDDALPEDFAATFVAGKYIVRRKKIVPNKDYARPEWTKEKVTLPGAEKSKKKRGGG
jgi:hypothetical protein